MIGECNVEEPRCKAPSMKDSKELKYPSWFKALRKVNNHFDCQNLIQHEADEYHDLVQANFQDNYYNNNYPINFFHVFLIQILEIRPYQMCK